MTNTDTANYSRTILRLQLLNNGFEPLANHRKMCLLEGWSKFEITEDLIKSREWRRSFKCKDTGIRCGKVIAVDIDILDKNLLDAFVDAVLDAEVIAESRFIRIGKPPKELWVFRTEDEGIGKSITGKFGGEEDEPEDGHQVEVLGKGNQFAAFGEHSDTYQYAWPDQNPYDHTVSELPLITAGQVKKLIEFATEFFESKGLKRLTQGVNGDANFKITHDLEPHYMYETDELGSATVRDIEKYLRSQPPGTTMRLRSSPFRKGEKNLKSVLASLAHGELCISDFLLGTSQFPATNAEMLEQLEQIGKHLKPRIEARLKAEKLRQEEEERRLDLNLRQNDDFDTALKKCLKRFVFLVPTNTIGDMLKLGVSDWAMTPDAFKTMTYPWYQETPKGRSTVVERLDHTWKQTPSRMIAHEVSLRPDMPSPFYANEQGENCVNIYSKKTFPAGGNSAPAHDFLSKLVPDKKERDWLLRWIATKIKRPEIRGHGVIMVAADEYGTGRGTLLKLFGKIFGDNLVASVDFATFTGRTYQAQYNEYMAENLVVGIEEAHETQPGETKWQQRNNAYEHLKNIVDPGKQNMWVARKRKDNSRARLYSSVCIFTNHPDAIAIPPKDRRFVVLENGPAQSEEYWTYIHEWMDDEANVGAFVRDLMSVDTSLYNPYGAPLDTRMKQRMIDFSRSSLDETVDEVLRTFAGDVAAFEQVRIIIQKMIDTDDDIDLPDRWMTAARRIFDRKSQPFDKRDLRIALGAKRVRPRILRNPNKWLSLSVSEVKEELLKNGGSPDTPRIVAFPSRSET